MRVIHSVINYAQNISVRLSSDGPNFVFTKIDLGLEVQIARYTVAMNELLCLKNAGA